MTITTNPLPKGSLLTERASARPAGKPTRPKILQRPTRKSPALRLSPTAWAKLLFLRDLGETEVGGFGIASVKDLLYLEDIQLVRQVCTAASVSFDDAAVADFFDRQVDRGLPLAAFGRIWVHTHPGDSPQPSLTDEETFARVFGQTDWAVMFILARGGQTYVRLEFHVGPGGGLLVPVEVDYTRPFPAADQAAWCEEYLASVQEEPWPLLMSGPSHLEPAVADFDRYGQPVDWDSWDDFLLEVTDRGHASSSHHHREGGLFDDDRF